MDLVKSPELPDHLAVKYEREAARYWHLFYQRNKDRFFKDRHYFDREFPQLLAAGTVLEVGCGVGNTIFPLLELNPAAFVYACDFAPSAVALVRSHPQYAASERVHAFVADITDDGMPAAAAAIEAGAGAEAADTSRQQQQQQQQGQQQRGSGEKKSGASGEREGRSSLAAEVPAGCVDACTMVFVLSAISPEKMPQAVRNVARTLKPGNGQVLFRDYAVGDLAQDRLAGEGRAQRIADNFFARWDGTRAYYFSEEGVRSLFEVQGFRCDYVMTHSRVVENRRQQASMARRFVQAVFTYLGPPEAEAVAAAAGPATCKPQEPQPEGQQAGGECIACSGSSSSSSRGSRGDAGHETEAQVDLGPVAFTLLGGPPSAAELCLSRLLLASPSLLQQRNVLELGSGSPGRPPSGLPSLAALRWSRFAVATAPSAAGLAAARRNAHRNARRVVYERLRLAELDWQAAGAAGGAAPAGEDSAEDSAAAAAAEEPAALADQHAALLRALPGGCDAIVGADLLSGAEQGECQQLACTLAALLAPALHTVALICQQGGSSQGSVASPLAGVLAAAAELGLAEMVLEGEAERLVQSAGSEGVEVLCLRRASVL